MFLTFFNFSVIIILLFVFMFLIFVGFVVTGMPSLS